MPSHLPEMHKVIARDSTSVQRSLDQCWTGKRGLVLLQGLDWHDAHLKASAAGLSYSMAHLVSAALALCIPQLSPPQPAKMSMAASLGAPDSVALLHGARGDLMQCVRRSL